MAYKYVKIWVMLKAVIYFVYLSGTSNLDIITKINKNILGKWLEQFSHFFYIKSHLRKETRKKL